MIAASAPASGHLSALALRRRAIAATASGLLSVPVSAGLLTALSLLRRALAPEGIERPLLAKLRLVPHALGLALCVYGGWLAWSAARAALATPSSPAPPPPEPELRRLRRWRRFASFGMLLNIAAAAWVSFTAYMIYDLTLRPR